MAVVDMKKFSLLALNEDKHRLLKQMQRMGCLEIVEAGEGEFALTGQERKRLEDFNKLIGRLDLCVSRLLPYDPHKAGLLSIRPQAQADQIAGARASRGAILETVGRVEEIERTRGELRAREARERAQIEQLQPWVDLEIPLNRLGGTRSARFRLLTVPVVGWEAFLQAAGEVGLASVEKLSQTRENVCAAAAVHVSRAEAFDEAAHQAGAAFVSLPEGGGTVAMLLDQLADKLSRIEEVRKQLDGEMKRLAEQLPMLRLLRDIEATERDRLEAAGRCEKTRSSFLMTGWVPDNRLQAVEEALKKICPLCEIEFSDPGPDEKPPTLLRNGKFVAPFESIVKMFSTPDPYGLDPTFIMMPFWVCFFGMMVSDAGYGILLGVAATFIWWKLKGQGIGRMAFVIAMGGLSTVIWGAIYGGWFGVTATHRLLDPMNDAIVVLLVCVAAGAVHILTGMLMAAYMNIKRGKVVDAICDQFLWIFLLGGLGLMLVNSTVGGVIALASALGVLFTAGRHKQGNLFKKLIGGFSGLYGITSYLSDLLSYARLFGMGLATGVIGMVVNMLAGMMMGNPFTIPIAIVILVAGHALNLAINTLGAYVHSCRLQYIEFFGKFFEAGGKDFRPLRRETRYVDLADSDL